MSDEFLLTPSHYAHLVRTTADEDLQTGLDENGELILEQIFLAMPGQLRPQTAPGRSVVAEWRIEGLRGAGDVRWQVAIEEGRCTVSRSGERRPDITFALGALDFVKLVTGNAKGPRLFLLGRLKIRGDLLKAARFQGYFRLPRDESRSRPDGA